MARRDRLLYLLVISCLCLLVTACGSDATEEVPSDADQLVPAVEAVEARTGAVPLRERLTGTVRAAGEVAIYPQVSGPVIEVLAQNGDEVTKGQPLVRLQPPGARAQTAQARSAVAAARAELRQVEARARELEAEYARNAELGKRGLVPANTVESLREQADAARAAVASAAAQLELAEGAAAEQRDVQAQTTVRAPISGRVGQRNVEVGMQVDTQTPLFVIGRLENMRVEVPVTQDMLPRIQRGQRVELRTGSGAPPIEATVSRISPFLEPGSFSAEVEIDVPNAAGALAPGMFVTVDIYYAESQQATLVPAAALHEDAASGEQGVFVVAVPAGWSPAADQGKPGAPLGDPVPVTFRAVDVIAEAAQTVGVEGVRPGELVVVIGQHLLATTRREGAAQARVRTMSWERILEMQQLQHEDLLRDFLERQRRRGAID